MGTRWYLNHWNRGMLLISNYSVGLIKWKHEEGCKAEFCVSVFKMLLIQTLKRKAYDHKGTLRNTYTNKPTGTQPLLFLPRNKEFYTSVIGTAKAILKNWKITLNRAYLHITHKDLKASNFFSPALTYCFKLRVYFTPFCCSDEKQSYVASTFR